MSIDIVIPVGPNQAPIVLHTIPSLKKYLTFGKIFIVSSVETFDKLGLSETDSVKFINEDSIVEGLTLSSIKQYFNQRIESPKRAAWYFQQFLKMGISGLNILSDNYLVWDADCVLLKEISFLDEEGKVIITQTLESHKPYFEIINKLLGISKMTEKSFISEHFLFSKKTMQELISDIEKGENEKWCWKILNNIDDANLLGSGFSEYETYGNYLMTRYPQTFRFRELNVLRDGGKYCGMKPTMFDLWLFSLNYSYVSFEVWTKKEFSRKKLISRVLREKIRGSRS